MNQKIQTSLTCIHKIIGSAPFLFEGSFRDGILTARKLGFDCVELHVNSSAELTDPEIDRTLAETGIKVSALGTGRLYVNEGLSLTDPDSKIRKEAVRQLKEFIDTAKRLNCLVILGCIRGNIPTPEEYDTILARLSGTMTELDAYACASGVEMVFEPINRYENNYLCSTYETGRFLHDNNLKNIKMMIDTFHMNIEERDLKQAIIDNINDIRYAHFADSNRLFPGQGHIDFPMIYETLLDNGYEGVISAECLPLPSKEEAAKGWLTYVKELMKQYDEK